MSTFIDELSALDSEDLIEVTVDKGPFSENPKTFYYTRFTLQDLQKINTMSKGDTYAYNVCTLIHKAMDKDGGKLFGLGDKARLMKMDSNLVLSMVEAMNQEVEVDTEKNS